MSTTMEKVVTQLQQELFTLRVQDTPTLIDVKGFGRPKEFSGRGEDFQQWSKKTEAFFAGVIKESEMILEWTAEQTIDITTTVVDLEFLPSETNVDREVQNLDIVLQHEL